MSTGSRFLKSMISEAKSDIQRLPWQKHCKRQLPQSRQPFTLDPAESDLSAQQQRA
ncbi:hypothetical protein [Pseudophaeobacter profundi]|uniref:hypothetical protein n=1 Tax=Pseudophaeobacter profundi TaxID=3034152 RepID=UPI0024307A45|nr:hypothetical protein [Pseudophaeobacter profundi]